LESSKDAPITLIETPNTFENGMNDGNTATGTNADIGVPLLPVVEFPPISGFTPYANIPSGV
jgi:hypothetical protein